MSGRSFRSVFMVASCAGAALGCYLVSLRVASERAALEQVETRIVLAQRDIRLLQTEIGTRGRLAQLERWNVKVLALSAPSADQFLDGGFALAKMVAPERKIGLDAPIVLAAAPLNGPKPQVDTGQRRQEEGAGNGLAAGQLLHVASLKRDLKSDSEELAEASKPRSVPSKPVADSKPAKASTVPKAKPVTVANTAPAKAKTSSVERKAAADPLAPLGPAKPSKLAAAEPKDSGNDSYSGKDSGRKQ